MIKIRSENLKLNSVITIDPYVPIDIKWGHWDEVKDGTRYCRFGDFKQSLLEIGVSSSNGQIRSITLVEVKNIKIRDSKCEISGYEMDIGTPVLYNDNWINTDRMDIQSDVSISTYEHEVVIAIGDSKALNFIRTGRVVLGSNEANELCLILIDALENIEMENIKNSLKYMI